jgi:transposase
LKVEGEGHFQIDEDQLKAEARYDGLWVLRTNTALEAETVAHVYKNLWMVEALFRTAKSILETRPLYHKCNETIRGHVFCSFLALVLKCELESRLRQAGVRHQLDHHLKTILFRHPQIQDEDVGATLMVVQANFLSIASLTDHFQVVFQRKDRYYRG